MATFKLFKVAGNRALYRQEGARSSVRMDVRQFASGTAPESIDIGGEGIEFAPITAAGVRATDSPEVAAAKKILADHRAAVKAAKEAAQAAKGVPAKGSAKKAKK